MFFYFYFIFYHRVLFAFLLVLFTLVSFVLAFPYEAFAMPFDPLDPTSGDIYKRAQGLPYDESKNYDQPEVDWYKGKKLVKHRDGSLS